jgi:hypothetical protein
MRLPTQPHAGGQSILPRARRSAISSRRRSARRAAMSTCSSAPAAKSASPTSCCGNLPTRSSTSSKRCGPILAPNTCAQQSPISAAGNGVSAGFPPRLRSSRPSDLPLIIEQHNLDEHRKREMIGDAVRSRQLKLVDAETEPVLERFVRSREEWLAILGILYSARDSGRSKYS